MIERAIMTVGGHGRVQVVFQRASRTASLEHTSYSGMDNIESGRFRRQ